MNYKKWGTEYPYHLQNITEMKKKTLDETKKVGKKEKLFEKNDSTLGYLESAGSNVK